MENDKNKISFAVFLFIIILFIVGGFIFMNYMINKPKDNTNKDLITTIEENENRIDIAKDFVYYENINRVLSYLEIDYKDIVINIKGAENITKTLNEEETKYRNSIVYIKNVSMNPDVEYEENDEGIYSLTYREYETYQYKDYLSIIYKDFDYNVYNSNQAIKTKSYIINKSDGSIFEEDTILKEHNLTIDKVKSEIRSKLNALQVSDEEGNKSIDIDGTLNEFKDYCIYINRIGKLEINYIVKSTNQNYYDNIVFE